MRSEYRTQVVRQCMLAYLRLSLLVAVLVPALLMFGEPVAAQESAAASINGRVVNPASRSGMSGVRVRLVETGATTSTGNDGSFRFGSVPPGSYALELSYIGMDTEVEQVTVAAGQRLDQEFSFGPATMDEVVVTGIRGAQAAALNEQRNNDNISNVISADQLGRFPDRNIAEAMRRVPGVSIEREEKAGDGRYVSIRGLDSGLNNFKLNGMNVAQQEEDNRRIPLDVIQVEAVSMITVNKTLLPDHDGDGIGGAVEMTSATAFDFDRHHVDITAEGFYNDFRGDLGSKLAGTYSTVFGRDDRWGILVSAAYADRKTAAYSVENDEDWVTLLEQDDDVPIEPGNSPATYGFGRMRIDNDRENIGLNTALSFQATPDTLLVFKGSYNFLVDIELDRGFYIIGDDDELYQNGTLQPEGGYYAQIYGEHEESEFRSQTYNFIGETQRDAWRFDYSAGYSEGIRDEVNDHELAFEKDLVTNPVLWNRNDPKFPTTALEAADQAAINDPTGWILGYNDIDVDRAQDRKYAVTFDATRETDRSGAFQYFKAGFKFQRSDRSLLEANVLDAVGDLRMSEDGFRGEDVEYGDIGAPYAPNFGIDADILSRWREVGFGLVADGVIENDYLVDGVVPADEDTYDATEDIYATYLMAQADFGKWQVIGGVRVEYTEISVNNLELIENDDLGTEQLRPITNESDYTEVLPRLQINYRASDDLVFRSAAFASLARPEHQFIAGTTEIEIGNGRADIFLGNPDLEAAYSWNFDVGVEYYFGTIGLASINLFYKQIDNFIFNDISPEGDFDTTRFENDPRFAGLDIGSVETFVNGNEADVYGVELNYVQQFTNLQGFMSGFGVYMNLTLQESNADSGIEGRDDVEFFNAPGYVGTAALTYQGDRFDGTLAYSFRDRYLFEFVSYQESLYDQDYDSLDIQLNYQLTDQFRLMLRANDVLDDGDKPIVRRTFGTSKSYLDYSVYNGRNITFGVNARF